MFLISQVSKLSKVSIPNIRIYESIGWIKGKKNAGIRKSVYTYYDQETIDRLELIEECKSVGMCTAEITTLINVWFGQRIPNSKRVQVLGKQLEILEEKQAQINHIKERVEILMTEVKKFL